MVSTASHGIHMRRSLVSPVSIQYRLLAFSSTSIERVYNVCWLSPPVNMCVGVSCFERPAVTQQLAFKPNTQLRALVELLTHRCHSINLVWFGNVFLMRRWVWCSNTKPMLVVSGLYPQKVISKEFIAPQGTLVW